MSELRENSLADILSELSQESVELIRQELRLVVADVVTHGRDVGTSAGMLGGAAALGVGAFGALTAGLIAALQRRPSRGALIVATLYGAGAAGLADAGVKRLGQVAPELLETIQRDLKPTGKGSGRASEPASRKAASSDKPRKAAASSDKPRKAASGTARRRKPAASKRTRGEA